MNDWELAKKLDHIQENISNIWDQIKLIREKVDYLDKRMKTVESIHPKILPKENITGYGKIGDFIIATGVKYEKANDSRPMPFPYLYDKISSSALYSGKGIPKNSIERTLHRCLDNLNARFVVLTTGRGKDRLIHIAVYDHDI